MTTTEPHPTTATVSLPVRNGRPPQYLLSEVRKIDGLMGATAKYDPTDRTWTITVPPGDRAVYNSVSSKLEWCAERGAEVAWA